MGRLVFILVCVKEGYVCVLDVLVGGEVVRGRGEVSGGMEVLWRSRGNLVKLEGR